MWKFSCEIQLSNDDIARVRLKIPIESCFLIQECYYYSYHWDEFGYYIIVSTYVEVNDKATAYSEGLKKVNTANCILSFLYGFSIGNNINLSRSLESVNDIDVVENFPSSSNIRRLKSFKSIFDVLPYNEKSAFIKCTEFFTRGFSLHYSHGLSEEACLNIFKIIELISSNYSKGKIETILKANIKKHFNLILNETFNETFDKSCHSKALETVESTFMNLITLTRKIKYFIEQNGLKSIISIDDIKKIVSFRNSIIAHGNSSFTDEESIGKYFDMLLILARESISMHFFKKWYKEISLKVEFGPY